MILLLVSICRCFGFCCRKKQTKQIDHNTSSTANNYILSPEQPLNHTDIEQQSTQKGIDHQSQSSKEIQQLYNDKGLVKVIVPLGKRKGDKFRVKIFDGRTVDTVVPEDGISDFYMKVPKKKQNWHDNPLATLPMAVGPLF